MIEIERRFYVNQDILDKLKLTPMQGQSRLIAQGYLPGIATTRVRISTLPSGKVECEWTLKTKLDSKYKARKEYNVSIPYATALELIRESEYLITKRRFCYTDGNLTFEVDVFEPDDRSHHLHGFMIAEIEFASEADAQDWDVPEALRDYEVTNTTGWSTKQLAKSTKLPLFGKKIKRTKP